MKELSRSELENVSGGIFPLLLAAAGAVGGIVLAGVIADWSDFKAGLVEGYNNATK